MLRVSRRVHLRGMLGMVALAGMPGVAFAEDPPVPPEGIGRRIKHVSYSDIGGRPDSVQIMLNRNHLYVGHMFGDGVTILDASDPRSLKPVNFLRPGSTPVPIIFNRRTICFWSPMAPISSPCSPIATSAAISKTIWPTASPNGKISAAGFPYMTSPIRAK